MKTKLIMTLLVRDEEDILEYNICHHLNQGVDFIVAIDNGSTDGTVDILKKYQKKGVLSYSIINKHTYEQDVWVSQMAKEAVEKQGATHLFHCDADEFWYSNTFNLKDQLNTIKDVAYVFLINYLPPVEEFKKFNFNNFHYIFSNPVLPPKKVEKMISSEILNYRYSPKIITTNKFININYGNHSVKTNMKYDEIYLKTINIHHFPIRSFKHFEKKVINGGSSFLENPLKSPMTGWQWKKWYIIYKNGGIKNEYDKISRKNSLLKDLKNGTITRLDVPKRIKYSKIIYFFKRIIYKFNNYL